MKIRPLIVGPEQRGLIAALMTKAKAEMVPYAVMKRLHNKARTPELATMNDDKTVGIPEGYRATFTIEEHKPGVPCRHLSVSVGEAGVGPSQAAVAELMIEFGFKNKFGMTPMYLGELGEDRIAVNLIEPMDGDLNKLRK